MMNIRLLYKVFKKCNVFSFFKYNYFSPNIIREKKCYIYPYRGSIIQIDKTACINLNGNLFFNANKYKKSRAESYLVLDSKSKMTISGDTRVNYGSTIHINSGAELHAGSFTTNVGINFQVINKVEIGKDCMFGRNVTIFDSAFHPTGVEKDNMIVNSDPVILGDHVWVGANSFLAQGTQIGKGSMIGSGVYFRGKIENAISVIRDSDTPKLAGNMWARSNSADDINQAISYYKIEQSNNNVSEEALTKYKKKILDILKPLFPTINLEVEERLLNDHKIDSLSVINIVKLLENEYNISIPYYEISVSNFNNVDSMASLIDRLLTGKTSNLDIVKKSYLKTNDEYEISAQNSLIEYVKEHSVKNPNKIAVISNGNEYTYQILYKYARLYGSFLINKGLNRGEKIVVKSIQSIDYIIIYLGAHYAGAVISTVEKAASDDKIMEIAEDIEAKFIISDHNPINNKNIEFINSKNIYDDVANIKIIENDFPKRTDSADILFTTGTTGKSKGVELSHIAVIAGAENIAFGCEMKRDTVLVVPNPLSHSNAIKNMAACFITGCTFYVLDGITDLKAYFDALDCSYGRVATVLPPAAIRTLFQLAKDKLASYVDKLDYLMAATAPLLEPDRETLRQLLHNTRLYNHYGCSESSSICIYDFNKYSELKNCVGKAMPHSRVFFVDDDKKEIKSSTNNIGLLAVEGDATMKGYYNAPELTQEIKNGQIIYTKDMGYIDDNGFVFILGRNDDIINVGGLKVSPLDVEAVTLSYDGVADCICIAVDDDITGQALKLLVVPGESFNKDKLDLTLESKLEGYKIPKQIELVDKVERTYNGKINRKAYRK